MKTLCLLGVAALLVVACENDKMTDIFNSSQFYYVRVEPQSATLAQGGTQTLAVTAYDGQCGGVNCNPLTPGNPVTYTGTITFRSTDPTVATVTNDGTVTALAKAGTTNIIGTLQNIPGGTSVPSVSLADTTPVTVLAVGIAPPAVSSMTLTSSRSTNGAGSNDTLTVTYIDAGGATVATQRAATNASGIGRPGFFTSDPLIATVGATGIVTGVKPGTATITAATSVGGVTKTATFPITITDPVFATVSITTATSGEGIIFFPPTTVVSATQAIAEGRPNTTTPGAVVTWGVFGTAVFVQTFRPVIGASPPDPVTTTPNSTDCFNVVFANPVAAGAAPTAPVGSTVPAGNTGNIGDPGPITAANPRLCSIPANNNPFGKDAQSRLFTTPGTYTFVSNTPGSSAAATLIVK
jgi:uncharacterized protein YjdB